MGPLKGYKIVEMPGIGPGPFCGMMLADMGADVVRIDRMEVADLGLKEDPKFNLLNRGKRSVAIDLKNKDGVAAALRLVDQADALIEGFRPSVMERLGLGPDVCMEKNPKLVYGRVTGWGQHGSMKLVAGHDINYIALTGILDAIGRKNEAPLAPLNLIGDFGGGATYLAFGIVCALLEAAQSGKGQVVDAAMIDGASSLMTMFFGLRASGQWKNERGTNPLDTGAPFYNVYLTADRKYIAIGAIEARFFAELLDRLGIDERQFPRQWDEARWPEMHERFCDVFRGATRTEWCETFKDSDACFAPVLSIDEAIDHPHIRERGTFVEYDGVVQPAPTPRFSRTNGAIQRSPPAPGDDTVSVLTSWGFSDSDIASLERGNAIRTAR